MKKSLVTNMSRCLKVPYDCGKKLTSAGLLHFAPSRSQQPCEIQNFGCLSRACRLRQLIWRLHGKTFQEAEKDSYWHLVVYRLQIKLTSSTPQKKTWNIFVFPVKNLFFIHIKQIFRVNSIFDSTVTDNSVSCL